MVPRSSYGIALFFVKRMEDLIMTQLSQSSITALQMVGHSLVRDMFAPGTVVKVTIVSGPGYAAMAHHKPADRSTISLDDIRNEALAHLAGVAAVRELTGSADTGCSASFIRAHAIAMRYLDCTEGGLSGRDKETRAQALVTEWYDASVKLVREKNSDIRRIADVLVEKGTLTGEEFSALVN